MKNKKNIIIFGTLLLILIVCIFVIKNNNKTLDDDVIIERHVIAGKRLDLFFRKEEYKTSNKDKSLVSNNYRNIVYINSDYDLNKVSKKLKKISDDNWNNVIKTIDEQVNNESNIGLTLSVNQLFSTSYINDNVVSFNMITSGFDGIYIVNNTNGYNFSINRDEILTIRAIAYDYDKLMNYLLDKIYYIMDDYEKSGGCVNSLSHRDDSSNDDMLEDIINTYDIWYYTEKGINITFSNYSLICDDNGSITIEMPKDEVNKYLKDEYKV